MLPVVNSTAVHGISCLKMLLDYLDFFYLTLTVAGVHQLTRGKVEAPKIHN